MGAAGGVDSTKEVGDATRRWNRTDRRERWARNGNGARAGTRPDGRLGYGAGRKLCLPVVWKNRAASAGRALLAGGMPGLRCILDAAPVKIAIASGKGGTGKTTVAVNLACMLADRGERVQYLDCDVEAPNGHLFLKPRIEAREPVGIPVLVVDEETCTGCRTCAEVCAYHALAVLKKPVVFPELCHGYGGCALVCPSGAIREVNRPIGVVETGRSEGVAFVQGRLNVGEPMAPPLIRAVKKNVLADGVAILNAPPGTSCPVVAVVRDADYVLLVTEPTPFGLHDLKLAVAMVRGLGRRHGVVINRATLGYGRVRNFCAAEAIPMVLEIPDDRFAAEVYSRGQIAFRLLPEWHTLLTVLWQRIQSAS